MDDDISNTVPAPADAQEGYGVVKDSGEPVDESAGSPTPEAAEGQGAGLGAESNKVPVQNPALADSPSQSVETDNLAGSDNSVGVDGNASLDIEAGKPPMQGQSFIKLLLARAGEKIQFNRRKKLEKIVALARQKALRLGSGPAGITVKETRELLGVSDSSATRYLRQLEKQGRLIKHGQTKGEYYQAA